MALSLTSGLYLLSAIGLGILGVILGRFTKNFKINEQFQKDIIHFFSFAIIGAALYILISAIPLFSTPNHLNETLGISSIVLAIFVIAFSMITGANQSR